MSIHRWVNWIAGFSADFVNSVLDRYLGPDAVGRACVLDPFAGVGTTNLEALRRGFHTCGFELNPFAALAARCKLGTARVDLDRLRGTIDRYRAFMLPVERQIDQWWTLSAPQGGPYSGPLPLAQPPEFFRARESFYSRPVELKVLFTLDFIRSIQDIVIEEYFSLAVGSTMISYSNYSYEPSLCSRAKLGKPLVLNSSVCSIIANKLEHVRQDIAELVRDLKHLPVTPSADFFDCSFFEARNYLAAASIDLVITSPPYLNNYHYVRNTRPQLYWLGFVHRPRDLQRFETQSFGKFWQTVREGRPIDLCFKLPSLETQLAELRTLNVEKRVYGGAGWANYAASYFNDSYRFFQIVGALLRPNGHAVVVVGNSLLQGVEFRVDEILAQIARLQGLDADTERIRSKRVGDSIVGTGLRQKPRNGRPELYEAAVVVRR